MRKKRLLIIFCCFSNNVIVRHATHFDQMGFIFVISEYRIVPLLNQTSLNIESNFTYSKQLCICLPAAGSGTVGFGFGATQTGFGQTTQGTGSLFGTTATSGTALSVGRV